MSSRAEAELAALRELGGSLTLPELVRIARDEQALPIV